MVLAAAGNLGHDDVLALVEARFPTDGSSRPERERTQPAAPATQEIVHRDSEQSHVVMGLRAFSALDPDRYALTVLNQALGGGMSSRLFQEVREARGLAYSVYSYRAAFDDNGYLAVYAGTAPARLQETLDVINTEFDRLARDGSLPADELDAAKGHLTGSLTMSLETSSSRMRRIGRSEQVEGEVPTLDELVARVDAITADDIARVIDRIITNADRTLVVVGPT
jgi:predicted Zn-dependent peptidase